MEGRHGKVQDSGKLVRVKYHGRRKREMVSGGGIHQCRCKKECVGGEGASGWWEGRVDVIKLNVKAVNYEVMGD